MDELDRLMHALSRSFGYKERATTRFEKSKYEKEIFHMRKLVFDEMQKLKINTANLHGVSYNIAGTHTGVRKTVKFNASSVKEEARYDLALPDYTNEKFYKPFKNFYRLFPKIRMSWSLYNAYISRDIARMWDYLIGTQTTSTLAMTRGKVIHEELERTKLPEGVKNLITAKDQKELKITTTTGGATFVMVIDVLSAPFIIDYKTGHFSGYQKQLEFYYWQLGLHQYMQTGKPPEHLDKIKYGALVGVDETLKVNRLNVYELGYMGQYWPNVVEEMYNEIISTMMDGSFLRYASSGVGIKPNW